MNIGTCTLCLAADIKTFNIIEANDQSFYEDILGVKIEYEAYNLCYICRARLRQCHLIVEQIRSLHKNIRENNIQNISQPLIQLTPHRCKDISISQPDEQTCNGLTDRRSISLDFHEEDVHIESDGIKLEVKEEFNIECSDTENHQASDYDDQLISDIVESKSTVTGAGSMQLPTIQIDKHNLLLDFKLPDSITVAKKKLKTKIFASVDKRCIDKIKTDDSDNIDKSARDQSVIDKRRKDKSGVEKRFRCDICDKAFKRSTYVTTHKRIHTGDKPYACDVCQERFQHQSHLTTHKRKHTGAKPYTCRLCAKKFSHSSSLLTHTKTHTRDKPFSCDVCEKKFHRRHDLKTHNRIHNGEKPYVCDVCSKKFTHVSHLITHKRTHTGVKPYHCEVCKKRFRHSSSLKKHMVTKHKGSYILGV